MRNFAWVAAAVLCACSGGKSYRLPQGVQPQKLYETVLAAHAKPDTVTAQAKAFVDAPENGGKYSLQIAARRTASLRIEALTPLGEPAAVLVANEGRFALFDLRRNEFYRGPSTPENLSRLFPVPLRDDELVALFTGGVPELRGAVATSASRDGDAHKIVLLSGDTEQTVWVHHEDLRVLKVERRAAGSTGPPSWAVQLEDHDDGSGTALPTVLKLSVPAKKIFLDLRIRGLTVGKPPPYSAFALQPPRGARVVDLD